MSGFQEIIDTCLGWDSSHVDALERTSVRLVEKDSYKDTKRS